jgi:hypothetical protein
VLPMLPPAHLAEQRPTAPGQLAEHHRPSPANSPSTTAR